jgi:hypothetical protein
MYKGLLNTLSSEAFVHCLAVLYDALSEISILSQHLQANDTDLMKAYSKVKESIRALKNQKSGSAGGAYEELVSGDGTFRGVELVHTVKAVSPIDRKQFLQALIDNLTSRLDCTVASNRKASGSQASESTDALHTLMSEIEILNSQKWPGYIESPWPEGERKLQP